MAQDIVSGLFGLSPYDVEQARAKQGLDFATRAAQMAPKGFEQAALFMGQGASNLARAGAGMLGMQDPAMVEAQNRQEALNWLDIGSPESIMNRAQQVTDPRLKMQLQMLAQQKMAERQKMAMEAKKIEREDFRMGEEFDWKKEQKRMELEQRAEAARLRSEDIRLGIEQRRQSAAESAALRRELAAMSQEARMAAIEQRRDAATQKAAGDVGKEARNAVAFLKEAGYDPETGKDEVTELIKKSTSGRGEALGAETAAFFGATTEGRKAINTLNATGNRIVMALMGGKLGAGISNADREFIIGQLGDIGNPNKTSEERLAAWNSAKNRMIDIGMVGSKPISAAPKDGQPKNEGKTVDFGSLK